MGEQEFARAAFFEHRFWLQILGDHSRFIHDALSPTEKKLVGWVNYFIKSFDGLLLVANKSMSMKELQELTKKANYYAQEMKNFKLHILQEQLVGKVKINLAPSFLNHMLNELEEYFIVLNYLVNQQTPKVLSTVHYHHIWLVDAIGHAATVNCLLDETEQTFRFKSKEFKKRFQDLYLKSVEIDGFFRTNLTSFPANDRFNEEVKKDSMIFIDFLKEVERLLDNHSLLGTLSPLMADHMAREECYYLTKVALATNSEPLGCDPIKPR